MKKVIGGLVLACFLVFGATGCTDKRTASREFNTLSTLYRSKMEAGKTTPEQDKEYIRAVSRLSYELDRYIRGTSSADRTKRDAEIMGATGVDPNAPIRFPTPPAAKP